MLNSERQSQICAILTEKRFATVKELSEQLFISESSIRRDLAVLERDGFLKRSHGGARIAYTGDLVVPFGVRAHKNIAAKQTIAKKAVTLINNGDIIFLDQTSTSFFLAVELLKTKSVTVVTNNREILNLLANSELSVIFTGGTVSKANNNCLVGHNAQKCFEEIYADIVFFSVKSLSHDGVISDCSQEEVFVRNSMLSSARKKVFLCDSSKIGTASSYKQCTLNDVDVLISDDALAQNFNNKFDKLLIL